MIKKCAAIILCLSILTCCLGGSSEGSSNTSTSINWNQDVKFTGMTDEKLLPYIEDTVYTQLISDFDSDEYFIEDVSAIYISQEYLAELAYNSQANDFFGYSLSDVDSFFEGTRYVFTVGDDGQTTVEPLQKIKDATYEQMLKNVAIGTGVILVCVTVSAVTAGAGAPAVSMIFAVAAKTAGTCALSGTLISGVSAAVVKGYQTGDLKEALKAGSLGASEGYKWGAISGALTGAAKETIGLYKATRPGENIINKLTMDQAAIIQKESRYPLDVLKEFHSYDEYLAFKNAGLESQMVNSKLALVKSNIDLTLVDEYGQTNLQRMLKGYAPIYLSENNKLLSYELHHIGQKSNGTLAILTQAEHNNPVFHGFITTSEIDRNAFASVRKDFWMAMGKILSGGK